MREYEIIYLGIEDGEEFKMVGSGHGANKQEAVKDFLFWHYDCIKVLEVKLYK